MAPLASPITRSWRSISVQEVFALQTIQLTIDWLDVDLELLKPQQRKALVNQ